MAVELIEGGGRVMLSEAPLVEGAVAAAAAARGGASLEEVRAEAAGALQMKVAQLEGEGDAADADAAPGAAEGAAGRADVEARIPVLNEIGLHARPAALVVALARRFDADLRLAKAGGPGPVSARSLTGLMTLVARKGDQLLATASGPQAAEAVAALEELAHAGFGDGAVEESPKADASEACRPPGCRPPGGCRPRDVAAPQPGPAAAVEPEPADKRAGEPAEPPGAGTRLQGIAASGGIALGPVRHLGLDVDLGDRA